MEQNKKQLQQKDDCKIFVGVIFYLFLTPTDKNLLKSHP